MQYKKEVPASKKCNKAKNYRKGKGKPNNNEGEVNKEGEVNNSNVVDYVFNLENSARNGGKTSAKLETTRVR